MARRGAIATLKKSPNYYGADFGSVCAVTGAIKWSLLGRTKCAQMLGEVYTTLEVWAILSQMGRSP
ncbi:hypothetical protein CCACVL1_11553 [Corchorus capsularis]|uniref:Uncharacterized protein n=1 Tax=Corchorus capsularis TaxID=210143 RepID=A0A1R3IKK4_COCAP|nr:hypothetical protein CCACVL1_11553 [Corchorus capsularis]